MSNTTSAINPVVQEVWVKASQASDHEKLREAIEWARGRLPARDGELAWSTSQIAWLRALADAAESTLPRTKMVEVWRVEYAVQNGADFWIPTVATSSTKDDAEKNAADIAKAPRNRCIRVTGPFQQEVPA